MVKPAFFGKTLCTILLTETLYVRGVPEQTTTRLLLATEMVTSE